MEVCSHLNTEKGISFAICDTAATKTQNTPPGRHFWKEAELSSFPR